MEDTFVDNLVRYCRVSSASSEDTADAHPSTARQFDMGRLLAEELRQLGLEDVELDEHCYVYGYLNRSNRRRRIVLVAHMDVSPAAPSEGVKPVVRRFEGKPVRFENGVEIGVEDLKNVEIGEKLVTSDGTTLLGGDDKAGIAIITTLLKLMQREDSGVEENAELVNIPNYRNNSADLASLPSVCVCFTPDEEIGEGTSKIQINKLTDNIPNCLALTIDGGRAPEVSFETFTAWAFDVRVRGFGVHPGDAFGRLTNAGTLGAELATRIQNEFRPPEQSKDGEGYVLVTDIRGEVEKCEIRGILRSFSEEEVADMREKLQKLVSDFESSKKSKVCAPDQFAAEVSFRHQYSNMRRFLPDALVARLKVFGDQVGANYEKIRGGTDGAMLSAAGLPCPNIWTGTGLYHSVKEHVVVREALAAVRFLGAVVGRWWE